MKIRKLMAFFLAIVITLGLMPFGMSQSKAVGELNPPTTDEKGNITFTYNGDDNTKTVWLAGEMNGWNKDDQAYSLKEGENNVFTLTLTPGQLAPKTYEFKYIVNSEWAGDKNLSFIVNAPVDYAGIEPTTDSDGNTTFTYYGNAGTKRVTLAGQMNNWKIDDNDLVFTRGENNKFTLKVGQDVFPLGTTYKFKYIIDGKWLEGDDLSYTTPGEAPEPEFTTKVIFHFDNPKDYDWALHVWPYKPASLGGKDYEFDATDEFGEVATVVIPGDHTSVGFLVKDKDWNKEYPDDRHVDVVGGEAEIWIKAGDAKFYYENPDQSPVSFKDVSATVHYHRYDPSELTGWKLYIWSNEQSEKDAKVVSMVAEEEGLAVASADLSGDSINRLNAKLVRFDGDTVIDEEKVALIKKFDENGKAEIWLSQGDPNPYTSKAVATLKPAITEAKLDGLKKVGLTFNRLIDTEAFANGAVLKIGGKTIEVDSIEFKESPAKMVTLLLAEDLEINGEYEVELYLDQGKKITLEAPVVVGKVVSDPAFDEAYAYDGELGAIYTPASTEFKVWAPTARSVNLLIFKGEEVVNTYPMERMDKGVYSYKLNGDQDGTVYMYEVDLGPDKVNRAVDPYGRSVTVNGQRSVVVAPSPSKVDRPAAGNVSRPIIWELHVRDLSNQASSGIKNRGKYLGLTEKGTKTPTGQVTGLDYIKSLGVTHVQLLPIYDFGQASVDETDPMAKFNWGYDPVNYNAPEGAYSTDPSDPYARIKELQAAVDAVHESGMGVIMDVVFNHVFSVGEHAFDKIVPGYYFRYDENGNLRNGTGVGNETASERAMMRKFMVDTLTYWAKTYKLDGFRFDLMGIHDTKTMAEVYKELVKIDPNIFILGEGWTMGSHERDAHPSDQVHANEIPNISMFNDHLRDLTKGSVFNATEGGFVNGAKDVEAQLMESIKTSAKLAGKNYDNPRQIVQYVEAHDNLTLWDKLMATNPEDSEETLLRRHKLATAIPLLAQGVPFIHAGQEFARTKGGNHNSYNAAAEVNELDWARAEKLSANVEYVRQLIAIRKSSDLFWLDTFAEIDKKLKVLHEADQLITYSLSDEDSTYYIGHNASDKVQTIKGLGNGTYSVLVRDAKANVEGLGLVAVKDGTIKIEPLSTLVLLAKPADTDDDPIEKPEDEKPGDVDDNKVEENKPTDKVEETPKKDVEKEDAKVIKVAPKTGDEFKIIVPILIIAAAIGGVVIIARKKRDR